MVKPLTLADLPKPDDVPGLFTKHGIHPRRFDFGSKQAGSNCGCLTVVLAAELSIPLFDVDGDIQDALGKREFWTMIRGFDGSSKEYEGFQEFFDYGRACSEAVFGDGSN